MSFAALDALDWPEFEPGTVWLVGAGPGAPGLLTLMGYHGLQQADVVVYDALVSDKLLALANPAAERVYARQARRQAVAEAGRHLAAAHRTGAEQASVSCA